MLKRSTVQYWTLGLVWATLPPADGSGNSLSKPGESSITHVGTQLTGTIAAVSPSPRPTCECGEQLLTFSLFVHVVPSVMGELCPPKDTLKS